MTIYFRSIQIESWQTAETIGSPNMWRIIQALRKEGIKGITAEDLANNLGLPKSTVYNILSKLRALGWVDTRSQRKRLGRPKKGEKRPYTRGKPSQLYVECIPWGSPSFNLNFLRALHPILEEHIENVKHPILEFFSKIVEECKRNPRLIRYLPSNEICEKCNESHEAKEFLLAIGTYLFQIFPFEELKKKYHFRK